MRAVKGKERASQRLSPGYRPAFFRQRIIAYALRPGLGPSATGFMTTIAMAVMMIVERGIMIQSANTSITKGIALLLCAPAALGACAGKSSDYPTFAMPVAESETGRVSMRFPEVTVPEPSQAKLPVEPLPLELEARLAAIYAGAMRANSAFEGSAKSTSKLALAAKGAGVNSDAWAIAELSLADLTTQFSATELALADVDMLAAQAVIESAEPEKLEAIAQLQSELIDLRNAQAGVIAAIGANLAQPAQTVENE